jgi:hypothetical protein
MPVTCAEFEQLVIQAYKDLEMQEILKIAAIV